MADHRRLAQGRRGEPNQLPHTSPLPATLPHARSPVGRLSLVWNSAISGVDLVINLEVYSSPQKLDRVYWFSVTWNFGGSDLYTGPRRLAVA